MNVPKIVVFGKNVSEFKGDLLVALVGADKKNKFICDDYVATLLKQFAGQADFEAKNDEQLLLYAPFSQDKDFLKASRLLLIGLGKKISRLKPAELFERLRLAGGNIAKVCKKNKLSEIGLWLPDVKGVEEAVMVSYLVEGVGLGVYEFSSYKKKDEDEYQGLKKISLVNVGDEQVVTGEIERALNNVRATQTARDMANEPGNRWTPSHFARFATDLANQYKLKCTVIEKGEMEELRMGGILAVNQGSHEAPKLIILEYSPAKPEKTIMLVGKGLTFDSGGISLKPAQGMMDMKYDMCGGAAALAAMEAVAREKPSVRVICLVPSTDNMNGGGAIKPGDVITHYGGVTAEIENTDAEGRLILADALAYGIEKYSPDVIIDLATLTGAVIIALGHHFTGLLSNNKTLTKALKDAASLAGEPVWQLPLHEAFAKQIKSEVADIKNTGGRPGGTITAAEYLHTFVGKTPWAHLDIAGTAWDYTSKSYIPKGPSGIAVRTLIEYIRKVGA